MLGLRNCAMCSYDLTKEWIYSIASGMLLCITDITNP